jgi:predicted  nucleic acid-binding Zn-ribbon protein
MQEFSDRVEKQLNGRVQELEKEMERLVPRLASTEGQLAAALQRAKAAELRANEAENALKRVEETIRTKILEKRLVDLNRRPIRAA